MIMKRLIPLLLLACGPAWGQGYIADIEHSATSVLLPCIPLRALDDTPAGGTLETGITSATAGLQISEKSDNEATWTDYTQAASTINAKSSGIGTWETPDASDVHFAEAESEGCYQIDFPDTTWSNSGAKYVQIKISDSSSPTFADTMVTVNLNATGAATLVDLVWDEPVSGHTTADTTGDQVGAQQDTDTTNIRGDISNLTDGTDSVWVAGYTIYTSACDSGSATTCVDATLTEADDYWNQGVGIVFTTGSVAGMSACVKDFTASTDTVTFNTLGVAVTTEDYALVAAPFCANETTGTGVGVAVGADEVTATAVAADAIGASEIATDAIGAAEIAADAIGASEIATDAIGGPEIAADAITSSEIAASAIGASELGNSAITATVIAADAIGSSELASTAVDEIWGEVCEDAGGTDYTCREVLSLLLSEAIGTCTYTAGTRTWVCKDPSNTETRFTLVYGSELDGDRSTSTPAPVTP
jgi:hypothetical protein